MILRVLMWDCALLKSCTLGINHVILSAWLGMGTVMQVAMVVLVRYIQRRVVVRNYMLLRRRVVLMRGFCSGDAVLWHRHY